MNNQELTQDYQNLLEQVDDFALFRTEIDTLESKDFETKLNNRLDFIREQKTRLWKKIDIEIQNKNKNDLISEGKNPIKMFENIVDLELTYFEGDRMPVRTKDGVWSFVDTESKTVTQGYLSVYNFRFDRAAVKTSEQNWDFIDPNGKLIFGGFKDPATFYDGLVSVRMENGQIYYYDRIGNKICGGYEYEGNFQCKKAVVVIKDRTYYINKMGEILFGNYTDGCDFRENIAAVRKEDKLWHYIDLDGNEIAGGFEHAWSFNEGRAVIKKKGEDCWGYIDSSGKKIASGFDSVNDFRGGRTEVEKDGRRFFIDLDCNEIKE